MKLKNWFEEIATVVPFLEETRLTALWDHRAVTNGAPVVMVAQSLHNTSAFRYLTITTSATLLVTFQYCTQHADTDAVELLQAENTVRGGCKDGAAPDAPSPLRQGATSFEMIRKQQPSQNMGRRGRSLPFPTDW